MKQYPKINYNQRPASYWNDADVLAALLRNVKGRERREMIRDYWAHGRLEELSEALLQETLSEEQRNRLGQIHPMFMGGEYLPDYLPGEVEIARIELQSTTADVIGIRARKHLDGIAYRVVDEYETEFKMPRTESSKPLSLHELVHLIDETAHSELPPGLALCYNQMNADAIEGRRQELRHFTKVTSEVYPQLYTHYESVFDSWVKEQGKENERSL